MSLKGYCSARCSCGYCPKYRHSSSTRQQSIQLFCASLLITVSTTLYIASLSGLFNKVARTQCAVQQVIVTSCRANRTSANSSTLTATIDSGPLSPSTSNTSSLRSASLATSSSSGIAPPSLVTSKIFGVDGYVSFHRTIGDGRGLGNQMFNMATVVYVAELTGRQPAIPVFNPALTLDEVFDLAVKRYADEICPCYVFHEHNKSLTYDRQLEQLADGGRYAQEVRGKSISLEGYFQSWKYTLNIEHQLRRHFSDFFPEIRQRANKFVAESRPAGWSGGYVRVGVHVRRGDVLETKRIEYGYTTPDKNYFARAMRYFLERFERVQYIVASNDIDWCRQNFAEFSTNLEHRVNVTYVEHQLLGVDFAILASCEHSIMSTGTYGWWAAWLARGITIYYADWPRHGSDLANRFSREDFFPPNWIGMT